MYYLVSVKTREEFGGKIPSHWIDQMNKYLGAAIVVDLVGDNYVTRQGYFSLKKSDFSRILLEDIDPNAYADIGPGWEDTSRVNVPFPSMKKEYGFATSSGGVTSNTFYEPCPTISYAQSPLRKKLLLL